MPAASLWSREGRLQGRRGGGLTRIGKEQRTGGFLCRSAPAPRARPVSRAILVIASDMAHKGCLRPTGNSQGCANGDLLQRTGPGVGSKEKPWRHWKVGKGRPAKQ